MDQWTAKSVNLLTGNGIVRMDGHAPSNLNRGGNYQAFCEEIDFMARELGCSGENLEERLFSLGGRKPLAWRFHVKENWSKYRSKVPYNAKIMHEIYPHIAITNF